MNQLHQPQDIISDRYRIVAPIGQGAFGMTYEAEDLKRHHCVAIKVLSLTDVTDWKILELFERESQVLERLNHPAIPNYIDYFTLDQNNSRRFYLVQELVPGESLRELVKKGWRCTEAEVYDIAIQLLEILDYLHRLTPPVIHRDLKPNNIIRKPDGTIYLVDFGSVQDLYRSRLIKGGTFVGTIGYTAPEQLRGQGFFASDLYSLGATLLYLLTHRSPEELPQKRMKIDFKQAVNISEEFKEWLDKMIEPSVSARFKSASEALMILKSKAKMSQPKPKNLTLEKPVNCLREPPKGSPVKVQRSTRRLMIKIPPKGWTLMTFFLLIFMLFWNIILGLLIALVVMESAPLPALLFLLPFLIMGVFSTSLFLFAIAGHRYLVMSEQTMVFGWHCLGISKTESLATPTLNEIQVNIDFNETQGRQEQLRFVTPQQTYKFAKELTLIEKEWLAEEIADFIKIPLTTFNIYNL